LSLFKNDELISNPQTISDMFMTHFSFVPEVNNCINTSKNVLTTDFTRSWKPKNYYPINNMVSGKIEMLLMLSPTIPKIFLII
jgi:hypothetical protein